MTQSTRHTSDPPDPYAALRRDMVERQLRARGIRDHAVLRAMGDVPRHEFVPRDRQQLAYEDGAMPIGQGQTISQPLMVAMMLEALELQPEDRVLDVGTGSGYQAALLGRLVHEVWSVEIVDALADRARHTLRQLGYDNVHVVLGDGSIGLPEHGPYDAIVVAAATPRIPRQLIDQLAEGGRLVIPVGHSGMQMLTRVRKGPQGVREESLGYCAFVPLVGAGSHE